MARDVSKNWQVFISCKVSDGNGDFTRDWHLAKELYELLEANSIRVFMSSFSLERLGESDYKQVIEEALDQARVMVVVGTSKENLNSKWVKYEWDSFHNEMISGRKKGGEIFTLVENLTINELPLALRQNQSFPVLRKSNLVKTIMRGLGANHTSTLPKAENKPLKKRIALLSINNNQQVGKRTTSLGNDSKLTSQKTESRVLKKDMISINGDELIYVEGGSFVMGDALGGFDNERPTHKVELTYDIYIGRFLVVFDEYDGYCMEKGTTKPEDSGWGRGRRPVINVSWFDAMEYCNWLSEKEGLQIAYSGDGSLLDGNKQKTEDIAKVKGYRLLTEAEWEYAARGGNKSMGYTYSGSNTADDVSWYSSNSGFKTHEVGQKKSNELGLYDMSGNLWEWCSDWWDSSYYSKSPTTNPYNSKSGSGRVNRGGSWVSSATLLRVARRDFYSPTDAGSNLGFRIARTVF